MHTSSLPISLVCLQCGMVRGSLGKVSWVMSSPRTCCVVSARFSELQCPHLYNEETGLNEFSFLSTSKILWFFLHTLFVCFLAFPLFLFQSGRGKTKPKREEESERRQIFNKYKHQPNTKLWRLSISFNPNNKCKKHRALLSPFYKCGLRG